VAKQKKAADLKWQRNNHELKKFTVICSFKAKPQKEEVFRKTWREYTQLIYSRAGAYEGNKGLRDVYFLD
jgi:hypothetical protein